MGPIMTTIDAALHDVKAPAATPEQSPGRQHALGSRVDFSQSSSIETIAYIATATPPAGYAEGDVVSGPGYHDQTNLNKMLADGLVEKLEVPADSGGQTWLYIEAGEALSRGNSVQLSAVDGGKYIMYKSVEAGRTKGFAQWNIPSGNFAWVLCAGVGKALVGASPANQGERIAAGTAGLSIDVTTPNDVGAGRWLSDGAIGALADADFACIA